MLTTFLPDLETKLKRPGLELQVEHYRAKGTERLALVMVHGFSAHCGLYRHVGAAFAAQGIAVTQFDCRGHGRSGGRRGHVDDFGDYLDDLSVVVDWARAQNANLPWALLGHSMGGAIALAFTLKADRSQLPRCLVLAAPWLRLKMKVWAPKRMAANVVARLLPTLTGPNGLKGENVSSNPVVHAWCDTDPLVHHVASAGWFMAMLRAQAHIREHASNLKVPTLLLLAGADRVVSNETTQAFARNAGDIVTMRTYDNLFHELFLETEADVVLADIAKWLNDSSVQTTTA